MGRRDEVVHGRVLFSALSGASGRMGRYPQPFRVSSGRSVNRGQSSIELPDKSVGSGFVPRWNAFISAARCGRRGPVDVFALVQHDPDLPEKSPLRHGGSTVHSRIATLPWMRERYLPHGRRDLTPSRSRYQTPDHGSSPRRRRCCYVSSGVHAGESGGSRGKNSFEESSGLEQCH